MSTENPYAASATTGMPDVPTSGGIVPATQGKRFLTLIIDNILLELVNFVAGFMLAVLLLAGGMNPETASARVLSFIMGLLIFLGYYTILEAAFGKTLGKLVMGTRVVNEEGGPASAGQILARSACGFIPFEFISFFFGDSRRPRGWHDSIPKTYVIEG